MRTPKNNKPWFGIQIYPSIKFRDLKYIFKLDAEILSRFSSALPDKDWSMVVILVKFFKLLKYLTYSN